MNSHGIVESVFSRDSQCSLLLRQACKPRFVLGCIFTWLIAIGITGCGHPPPEEIYEPENWQGEINTNLPAETQAQQDAIIRLFSAIQQVGIERIRWDCPDVRFSESFDEFFGSTVGIHRWEWTDEPVDDAFSVRIHFEQDNPTAPKIVEDRVYKVTRPGNGFSVKRVTPDSK